MCLGESVLLVNQAKEDIEEALEAWDWVDFSGKVPFVTTCFGDVFFDSEDGVFFLDSISGTLEKVASSKSDLQNILNTPDGQDHFLMAGLVEAAFDAGLTLNEGECYDFKVSPALNGPMDSANITTMSFKVSLHVAGQIMKQIKDLPPGTVITEVKLEDGT